MVYRVYKVFLASPSDVTRERKVAKKVVGDLNTLFGRKFNVTLDLVGWEDVPSSYGRPQGIINPHLEKCNLFIGLLWRTLGSPSGKGTLSGFEEEFQLACELKEKKKIEDVKLFFKDIIDEQLLKDPGDDLQRVLDFKADIETNKTIYYEKFIDDHDWEAILRNNLTDYLLQKIEVEETQPTSSPAQAAISETPVGLNETKSSDDEAQLVESLNETLKFLSDGDELNNDTRARLFLYSSSLFYGSNLPSGILKTHEIQYTYRIRKNIKPIKLERKLILRTVIEDKRDVSAGWFFFDIPDHETIELLFIHLSFNDPSESIRLQALNYIYKLSSFSHINRLIDGFDAFSVDEQEAIIDVIIKFYDRCNVPTLDSIMENNSSPKIIIAAWIAKVKILLREDEKAAVDLIKSTPIDKRGNLTDYLKELLSVNDKNLLKDLSDDNDSNLRLEIIKTIPESYTVEELRKILELPIRTKFPTLKLSLDNYYKIRATAMLELVKRGEVTDIDVIREKLLDKESTKERKGGLLLDYSEIEKAEYIDSVLLELYKRKSYKELYQEIDWYNSEDQLKYRALIEQYYQAFKETLHKDILDDFERIKKNKIKELNLERQSYIEKFPEKKDEIKQQYKKDLDSMDEFDGFHKSRYLNSALLALSRTKNTLPIEITRQVLNKDMGYFSNEIIFNLLDSYLKNGTNEDIENIRNLLSNDNLSDNTAIKVYKVLVKLDIDNNQQTLEILLDTDNPVLLKTLFSVMPITPKGSILDTIKSLLYHERDTIREVALSYLLQIMEDKELIEILENYPTQNSTYYYNVVCWLDRCLYAPDELKEHFRNDLIAKLV